MLDMTLLREQPEKAREGARKKGIRVDIDRLLELDARRRELLARLNDQRAERNRVSKEIGARKRAGDDVASLMERMGGVGEAVKQGEAELRTLEPEIDALALTLPNIPADSVPLGRTAEDNVLVREGGAMPAFDFEPKPHWDLGRELDILDFERGVKIAGSGFILYKGAGARLERALINYMADFHAREHGYVEVFPPFLVNRASLTGTGQLPKAEEDMYRCEQDDLFMIPTAEVPVTNIHRDEILALDDLPRRYVAYSACFRREAGSYGKDTRGLMRVHQFNKIELVRFERPEASYAALEVLAGHAEAIIRSLGLRYRVIELCTGELSFSNAKCYDIEVWAPGLKRWMEVSSCSNFEEFQARRANIRFRDEDNKVRFVHTLNGSGVATPRTLLALLETGQRADGAIAVPEPLRPYMGGLDVIS